MLFYELSGRAILGDDIVRAPLPPRRATGRLIGQPIVIDPFRDLLCDHVTEGLLQSRDSAHRPVLDVFDRRVFRGPDPVTQFVVASRLSDRLNEAFDFRRPEAASRQEAAQGQRCIVSSALAGPVPRQQRAGGESAGAPQYYLCPQSSRDRLSPPRGCLLRSREPSPASPFAHP